MQKQTVGQYLDDGGVITQLPDQIVPRLKMRPAGSPNGVYEEVIDSHNVVGDTLQYRSKDFACANRGGAKRGSGETR